MKDIKNGKLVKVGQTANKTEIKSGHILWLESETKKNIKTRKDKMYLPIKNKDVSRYIKYYEDWYNVFDKEGYKYVIEQLSCDYNFDYNKYYNEIMTSLHNFVRGGEFYKVLEK